MRAFAGAIALAAVSGGLQLDIFHERGTYRLEATVVIPAPVDRVWAVITDYDRLTELSPAITESGVVAVSDGGAVIVDTVTRSCRAILCRTLRHRQRVTETPFRSISAITDPAFSDFRSGTANWTLEPVSGGTHLTYRMSAQPDFFIPPVLGPAAVRYTLRAEAESLLDGVRERAQR